MKEIAHHVQCCEYEKSDLFEILFDCMEMEYPTCEANKKRFGLSIGCRSGRRITVIINHH